MTVSAIRFAFIACSGLEKIMSISVFVIILRPSLFSGVVFVKFYLWNFICGIVFVESFLHSESFLPEHIKEPVHICNTFPVCICLDQYGDFRDHA